MPTRKEFADIADEAFKQLDVAKVAHRVVSQENHANSETKSLYGKHYHMVLKLQDDLDCVEYVAGVKLGERRHTHSRYSNIKSKKVT